MVDEKKTLFDLTEGNAPALTDYCFNGEDPAGIKVLRRLSWQSIRNLFVGTPTADNDFVIGNSAGTWSKKTSTEVKSILGIDTFDIEISGGSLIAEGATGECDSGEKVTTPVNSRKYRVNKFEKGEVGEADLPWAPGAWDLSTVTAKIKHACFSPNTINLCDVAWDAAANVTCTADTSVYVEGTGSNKMACADGLAAGALMATDVITSMDLTAAKYIVMWFRSDVALNAGDVQFLLDDTATCASPVKTYDMPAIQANTWTKVELAAGDMSGCGAIISVGFKQVVDKGVMNCYSDQIGWTGTVTWQIQAVCVSSGDPLDIAQGTVQEISGDVRFYQDAELTFPTLTVGGTPVAGDRIHVTVTRKNNASDTHGAGKISFMGAKLICARS